MALNLPTIPGSCSALAKKLGAVVETMLGCMLVSGLEVKIGDSEHSVQEMAKIINFNFHTNGDQPPAVTQDDLPGSVAA